MVIRGCSVDAMGMGWGTQRFRAAVIVRDGDHGTHHAVFRWICDRVKVLRLLTPPCTGLRDILRDRSTVSSFHRVGRPGILWLLPPHIRIEEILLYEPVQLPKCPHGTTPKPTLDRRCPVADIVLVTS